MTAIDIAIPVTAAFPNRWSCRIEPVPSGLIQVEREYFKYALVKETGDKSAGHCHGNRVGRTAYWIGCRDGSALLPPSSLPARNYPARDLALCSGGTGSDPRRASRSSMPVPGFRSCTMQKKRFVGPIR